MPEQKPEIRKRNFEEVPTGYTIAMAQEEGCPVSAMQETRMHGRLSGGCGYSRVYQFDLPR